MALEKEAGVRVKLKGSEELVSDTKKISDAWGEVGAKAGAAFKGMAGVVGGAVQGVLSDIGHVVSAASAISFASSVQSAAQFEGTVTRMAVASGRQIKSTQDGINALAQDIGEMPDATEKWIHSVGDLTYNYERAAQSAKGLQGFAVQTGQNLGQVAGLASTLDQLGAGGEKGGRALEILTHQAEALGTVGGPRALSDMLQHLSGQVTELGSGGPGGVGRITALLAGFGGNKGFTPQQRERALGGVMGRIEGNVEGFERFIGKGRLTDEFGHMKDMTSVIDELKKYGSKGIGQQRRLEFTFGREATAAIMHTNIAAIRDEERDIGGEAGARALNRLKGSAAGQLQADQIAANVKEQEQFGSGSVIGGVYRTVMGWKATNPLLTGVGVAAGFKALAAGAKIFAGGGGAAAGGAGAAEVGAAGATAGGGGLFAGLGAGALGTAGAGVAGMLGSAGYVLHELGKGSAVHEGFDDRQIDSDQAAGMRDRIKAANDAAASNMSPGMRQALELERARVEKDRASRAAAAAAPPSAARQSVDPRMQAMIDQLVKAGASIQLAQETAAKLLAQGQDRLQIDVINATGGPIEARPRGHQ